MRSLRRQIAKGCDRRLDTIKADVAAMEEVFREEIDSNIKPLAMRLVKACDAYGHDCPDDFHRIADEFRALFGWEDLTEPTPLDMETP